MRPALLILAAVTCVAEDADTAEVTAVVETADVAGDPDDPAIFVSPLGPATSRVLATDKERGLTVFDLAGQRVQQLDAGRLNNVDLRPGFELADGRTGALALASRRSDNSVVAFFVDDAGTVAELPVADGATGLTVYGMCMGRFDGATYVYVNDKDGRVGQWEVRAEGPGVALTMRRTVAVDSQPEGCVVDDIHRRLYVGEEKVGIWRFDAGPDAVTDKIAVDVTGADGRLIADVEGLAIYDAGDGEGWLLASSQGDSAFAVYERTGDNAFVGRFRVVAGSIDAVGETDGIEVSSAPLGPEFPQGMFVAMDDRNEGFGTGFKYVDWRAIEAVLAVP